MKYSNDVDRVMFDGDFRRELGFDIHPCKKYTPKTQTNKEQQDISNARASKRKYKNSTVDSKLRKF